MKASKWGKADFAPASRSYAAADAAAASQPCSRPMRRYSLRIEAVTAAAAVPEVVNPSQPSTWDVRWVAAFNRVKDNNKVLREKLAELLILIGYQSPDESLVESALEEVTTSTSLSAHEVFDFIRRFEDRLREQLRRDFNAVVKNEDDKVPVSDIEELVRKRGFTPIPYAIQEVLEELGEDTGKGVTLAAFERLAEMLEKREGFCQSDLDILEGAFQRYDKKQNGFVEARELQALLESLDFCLDDGIVRSLAAQPLQNNEGKLTWKDFLCISRKRVHLEFDLCQELFKTCDDDEDGFLQPGEMMRMASKIGVSLLPETLADITEECDVNGAAIDFPSFWKMLQVLRAREGFTVDEAADIHEVFERFDSTGRGEMPLKRVPAAVSWLGYGTGPGVIGKANKQVEIPSTGSSYMTEAQFMKLARKHREAQLRAIRKVYRTFADDGGAGFLHMENLQAAVTRLNRLFVNDFLEWIKTYRPGARIARKHISFDYEEFRIIVLHCCDKLRSRFQRNCGFSEVQLSKLRIEFVKYTREGSCSEIDVPGTMRLFKALYPQSQTSPTVHARLKSATMSNASKHTGLDWPTFLRIVQAFNDLTEVHSQRNVQAGLEELKVPDECIDKAQDLLSRICHSDQSPIASTRSKTRIELTGRELMFLVHGIAPGLTEEEAEEALERLLEKEREGIEGEFSAVSCLKQIVLSGDLMKRSDHQRAHDLMGSL